MGVSTDRLSQAFSMALEQRSKEMQDLVTNSNVLMRVLKDKGLHKTYSGPTIRERLQTAQTGTAIWYSGYKFLNPKPKELFQDAEFVPKMLAVSPTISNEELLQNQGRNQLRNLYADYISAAQEEMKDIFDIALHSDGSAFSGEQLTGLQAAVPTVVDSGTYGGIDRGANTWWRTSIYDADTDFSDIGTQVTAATIYGMFERIVIERSRGKKGPNCILSHQNHYTKFSSALNAIQRITTEGPLAQLGFPSLKFAGAGKSMEVVLEGGIGSNMPADTSYMLDTDSMAIRYHPERYFTRFGGKQMPINQDAIVQHIGFMGEFTQKSPLHNAKIIDSDTAS